jgi:acetyl esterase/lipase
MSEAITDWSDAYDNVGHIPDATGFMEKWPKIAEDFRKTANVETNIPYDDGERNHFDLFHPEGRTKGLFVFVHGGYWLRFDKSFWSHLSAGPLAKGYAVAMPSYTLCPDAKVSEITVEIASSIEAASERIDGPIILSGHSAGGHLVTRQICQDSNLDEKVLNRIKRVISISGVHDLRPILNIVQNDTINLAEGEAIAESPALLKPILNIPVDCMVGADERPEFIRQNDLLANIWRGMGVATSIVHVNDKHHFDVIDDLINSDGIVCGTI